MDLGDLSPGRLDGASLPAAKVAEVLASEIEPAIGLAQQWIGVLAPRLAPFGPAAQIVLGQVPAEGKGVVEVLGVLREDLLASRHGEQLESALNTRDTIGQAKGVIMERYDVDAMRAFEMLRELSQTSNTRLVDIADRVIATRGA